ncbi:uncharacterized protein BP01DRAFT_367701 [Aspergillus saccharolyticus JOP 1030-1]|uniref:F-box domain-containing protein n=1 Tax=Aspergillus saccharolyticus JOP 1030-1 TaxID=1450539 RepID=A0A318Z998_9EURO|nr:hypothetical protein BP01DRAFT_367701 [Aspergillus saccharolyticus JOP 1030-1]PYH42954.1 hypothetical protein BP01DRAFT_367701 [Aspergillus saccharolyticus JOP 1030-1]
MSNTILCVHPLRPSSSSILYHPTKKLPMEILDRIIFFAVKPTNGSDEWWQEPAGIDETILTISAMQELLSLRLVNQAFCRSASALLFRQVYAVIPGDKESRLTGRLEKLLHSPYVSLVRRIDLGDRMDCCTTSACFQKLTNSWPETTVLSLLRRFPALRSLSFYEDKEQQDQTGGIRPSRMGTKTLGGRALGSDYLRMATVQSSTSD